MRETTVSVRAVHTVHAVRGRPAVVSSGSPGPGRGAARGPDLPEATDSVTAVLGAAGERLVRFAAAVGARTGDAAARAAAALAEELRHDRARTQRAGKRGCRTVQTDHPDEAVLDAARARLLRAAQQEAAGTWPDTVLGRLSPTARALLHLRAEEGYDAFRTAAALGLDPADVDTCLAELDADLRARRTTPAAVLGAVGHVPADGLAADVARRLATTSAQARRARRRGALVVGALASVAPIGLGAAAVVGQPGGSTGAAASTTSWQVAGTDGSVSAPVDCGRAVGGDSRPPVPLTLTSQGPTVVDRARWSGSYGLDPDMLTPEQYDLADLGELTVVPVLTDGLVVVGVPSPDAGRAAPRGHAIATFVPCGADLAGGSYDVLVVAYTADRRRWLVSNSVPLRILDAHADPPGERKAD